MKFLYGKGKEVKGYTSQHIIVAFESDCNTLKWHIARINHKSNARCQAQQRGSNIKCSARITMGKKGIPTPTYCGRKEDYWSKDKVVVDFKFCWDNIERCLKGTKWKWIIDWPKVLEVWPFLSGTNLSRDETLLLQHVGFHLQECPTLSPHLFFNMSKIFKTILYD